MAKKENISIPFDTTTFPNHQRVTCLNTRIRDTMCLCFAKAGISFTLQRDKSNPEISYFYIHEPHEKWVAVYSFAIEPESGPNVQQRLLDAIFSKMNVTINVLPKEGGEKSKWDMIG